MKTQVIAAKNGKWRMKKRENDAAVRIENEEIRECYCSENE